MKLSFLPGVSFNFSMETKDSNIPFKPLNEKGPTQLFDPWEIPKLPISMKSQKSFKQKLDHAKRDQERSKIRNKRGYKFIKELWQFNTMIEKAVVKKTNIDCFQSEAKFLYEKAKKKEISNKDLPWYVVVLGTSESNSQPTYYMHKLQNSQEASIPKVPIDSSSMDFSKKFTIEHQVDLNRCELQTFPHGYINHGYCCKKHFNPQIEDLSKDDFGRATRLYPLFRRY